MVVVVVVVVVVVGGGMRVDGSLVIKVELCKAGRYVGKGQDSNGRIAIVVRGGLGVGVDSRRRREGRKGGGREWRPLRLVEVIYGLWIVATAVVIS